MKKVSLVIGLFSMCSLGNLNAQESPSIETERTYADIMPEMKKKRYKKIFISEMKELLNRAEVETDCENYKYYVVDKVLVVYNGWFKTADFPSTVVLKGCNKSLTYIHVGGGTGSIESWAYGKWILNSTSTKTEE